METERLIMFFDYDYDQFKIDLIVWKLSFLPSSPRIAFAFKIDLIVWKQQQLIRDKVIQDEFKIDLIVWKRRSLLHQHGRNRKGLKQT